MCKLITIKLQEGEWSIDITVFEKLVGKYFLKYSNQEFMGFTLLLLNLNLDISISDGPHRSIHNYHEGLITRK